MGADQLLRLHGEEVAVEHGGGLDEVFRQRDGRKLDGEAARLQHAALHILHPLLEMGVQGLMSDQVLMMAMAGRPMKSDGA